MLLQQFEGKEKRCPQELLVGISMVLCTKLAVAILEVQGFSVCEVPLPHATLQFGYP